MPSTFRHLAIFGAASAAFAAAPAAAQGFQDIDAIEQQVTASLGAGIGEPGGPARPIDRRLRLTACPGPLVVEPVNLGAATVRCQQIGWRIRVPVLAGGTQASVQSGPASARATRAARAEPVVRRGDPVSLVVMSGNFTVSRQAVAQEDGAPGERIRVRTDPRKPVIIGEVLPDGRVAMPGF